MFTFLHFIRVEVDGVYPVIAVTNEEKCVSREGVSHKYGKSLCPVILFRHDFDKPSRTKCS